MLKFQVLSGELSNLSKKFLHYILAQSGIEKATVLSFFFAQCFNYSTAPLSFSDMDIYRTVLDCPEEFLCTEEQVLDSLDTT